MFCPSSMRRCRACRYCWSPAFSAAARPLWSTACSRLTDFSRAAVVVNEYGEVSIDHVLVEAPRHRMRVIDGGCLCGHVHDEVASSLLDLQPSASRRPERDFDCVLIEMSGLADPVPVIQILLTDRHVTALYELETVIAVADGVHGSDHLALPRRVR